MAHTELFPPISYSKMAAHSLHHQQPPNFREEDWKYTHFTGFEHYTLHQNPKHSAHRDASFLRSIPADSSFSRQFHPNTDNTWLAVLINGILQPQLSKLPDPDTGIKISMLSEAYDPNHEQVPFSPGDLACEHGHYFSRWALAQKANGLFIEVKKNVVVHKPLLIRQIIDLQEPKHVQPSHHVFVMEPNSVLTLSEVLEGEGAGMNLSVHEIHIGSGANLRHSQIQLWGNHLESIQQVLVAQQNESQYAHFAYSAGGGKVRNQLTVMQNGQQAHTELTGLVVPGAGEHLDNQTFLRHSSPNCSSRQRYRSLVGRAGTSVFNGKVFVDAEAQKTDAYQHHASLLMHETAVSNAKPELEIYADDVKCSHGATTGMLDAGEIHYMRSRGLSEIQARMLLQEAFVRDLIDSLPVESLRSWCMEHCSNRLSVLNQVAV